MFRYIILIFLLNLYDTFITLKAVATGEAFEANPLLADWVMEDPSSFAIWKTIVCLLALAGLALGYKYHEKGPSFKRTAKFILILYIMVCYWNSIVYMSLITSFV